MLEMRKASEDKSPWCRSSAQNSQSSKEKKSSIKRCDDVTQQFHQVGLQVRDKMDSWHKSIKESQKREEGLVSLTIAFVFKKMIS